MKFVLFLVGCFLASAVLAHGSSHPKSGSDGGSVINADVAPRAIIWYDDRLWATVDGAILVCPRGNATAGAQQWHNKHCFNEAIKGDGKQSRWVVLQDYKVTGMVLKSYEYRFIGSSGQPLLITYYGPAVVETVKEPAVTLTGPITINADKVVVQRRAK